MLSTKNITATFFVITHLRSYNGKALLATRPELVRDIHRMGHEIASHTKSHPLLVQASEKVVEEECLTSRNHLSELIGGEVTGFAYPYGGYNGMVTSIVERYYKYARIMGVFNRWNTDSTNRYTIGGIGRRHLVMFPFQLLRNHKTNYVVLVFHEDPPSTIAGSVRFLRLLGSKFVTLSDLVEKRTEEEMSEA